MDVSRYRFIAHRGLYNLDNAPENSIAAFVNAINLNYAIELDVNLTKDGKLIVFHDKNFKRMTGIDSDIDELDLVEVKKLKLNGTENRIPTLNEVLCLVNGRVPLMIEVKTNEKYDELMRKVMQELDNYNGEYVIGSFDPRIVNWLRMNRKEVTRGQIICKNMIGIKNKFVKLLMSKMFFNVITKPDFISYQYQEITEKKYKKQRNKNRYVAVWTVKTNDEYRKIKDYTDMIIFENKKTVDS